DDGIRDFHVTGVQTCALPIWSITIAPRSSPMIHTLALPSRGRASGGSTPEVTTPLTVTGTAVSGLSVMGCTTAFRRLTAPRGRRSEEHREGEHGRRRPLPENA